MGCPHEGPCAPPCVVTMMAAAPASRAIRAVSAEPTALNTKGSPGGLHVAFERIRSLRFAFGVIKAGFEIHAHGESARIFREFERGHGALFVPPGLYDPDGGWVGGGGFAPGIILTVAYPVLRTVSAQRPRRLAKIHPPSGPPGCSRSSNRS